MPKIPHRRKCYLINKKLQLRYSFYIFATLVIVTCVSSLFLSLGFWNIAAKEFSKESIQQRLRMASRMYEYQKARGMQQSPEAKRLVDFSETELLSIREKEILADIIKDNNSDLVVRLLLLFVFISIGAVFLTHKIAGPLFRFHATFKELQKGNLKQRVRLRRGDQGRDIVPDLNSMIGHFDFSFSKIKTVIAHLVKESRIKNPSVERIQKLATIIQDECNRYTTSDSYADDI